MNDATWNSLRKPIRRTTPKFRHAALLTLLAFPAGCVQLLGDDFEIVACDDGATFLNDSNVCETCGSCATDEYVASACNSTTDIACRLCDIVLLFLSLQLVLSLFYALFDIIWLMTLMMSTLIVNIL